jgi:acyl carrier protein
MTSTVTVAEVIAYIRESQGITEAKSITTDTLLECDLGITGDDGSELLEDLQKRFGISFAGALLHKKESVLCNERVPIEHQTQRQQDETAIPRPQLE